MGSVRGVLFLAAAMALCAAPAWANGHEHGPCEMHSQHAAAADMHHGHSAEPPGQAQADALPVEEIPVGTSASADENQHCSHGGTVSAAKCEMNMPHCKMTGGCCIKGAGPLSTGAKDKAAGQEDNANLPLAHYLNVDERSAYLLDGDLPKIELAFSPIPRPPSA